MNKSGAIIKKYRKKLILLISIKITFYPHNTVLEFSLFTTSVEDFIDQCGEIWTDWTTIKRVR